MGKTNAYTAARRDGRILLNANESSLNLTSDQLQKAAEIAAQISYNRYPDPAETDLLAAFGNKMGISPDCLLAGNGSDQMLGYLITTYLGKGKTLLTLDPDFSMYRYYAGSIDAKTIGYKQNEGGGVNMEELIAFGKKEKADMILFSNPNNPTGSLISRNQIEMLVQSFKEIPVVIDEAYMDFARDETALPLLDIYDNLFVTRTLSKAYGLAALRVGFLAGNAKTMAALKENFVPYAMNSLSMAIAAALLPQIDVAGFVKGIKEQRQRMYEQLSGCRRLQVWPSQANFLYGKAEDLDQLLACLQAESIVIRTYQGTPYFRITIGTEEENQLVCKAIQAYEGEQS
ncbi:MAG: histidinol-phosphate transaminase [Lactimicrobium sp.]|jgi:histidinol-phosphate aminotransferase|uniref:pyridoxal phosphate-dependent aminotransferase n=1 Tax=Lactimicrobium sp. TaxID=2563780 RepID=UPI002F34FB9D